MKQETTRILFKYWNEVRGSRPAPRRIEIEPARIAAILPDSFILERVNIGCYRFRLAGTRVCEHFGAELRGQNFLDLWSDEDRRAFVARLAMIVSDAGVGLFEFEAVLEHRRVQFEAILVPLIQSGTKVDRILGAMSPTNASHGLGAERSARRGLLRHELIWSERQLRSSTSPVQATGAQRALPHQRAARLVNVDRRQFRVYEGGLSSMARSRLSPGSER
jgi:hypothetical protein